MKIDRFISELLYDHDCVIVTGLGGFIAHYHPAAINPVLNVISPPSKKLAFNASLQNNDGLLANHISHREKLLYADACEVILQYVKESKIQLLQGKKLKIEKIGTLYYDQHQTIQFLPDQHVNYLVSSYGMTPVHAPQLKKPVEVAAMETNEEFEDDFVRFEPPVEPRKAARWKILEVIPAAAVLAFLFIVPPFLDNFNANLGTMLPFSRINEYIDELKGNDPYYHPININYPSPFEVPPAYNKQEIEESAPVVSEEPAPVQEEPAAVVRTTPEPADASQSVKAKQETQTEAPIAVEKPGSNTGSFHIIVGSFRSEENAEKLVAELKSKQYDASVVGQNKSGLYLVSALGSGSRLQLEDALPEIKSSVISSAWIYKK